jgi:acyl transferase domain-containing protein
MGFRDDGPGRSLGFRCGGHLRSGCSPENDPVQSFLCDQLRIVTGCLALHHNLWIRGIRAHWRMGHSLGEISALTAAGWIDVDTALRLVCLRSRAIVEYAPTGGMTAVNGSIHTVQSVLTSCRDLPLTLSTVNSPSQVTVSGRDTDLETFEGHLSSGGHGFKRLHARYPFHGPLMAPAAEAFARAIARERFAHGAPVWSPILGRAYVLGDRLNALLAQHLVLPVMFRPSVDQFARVGTASWTEVGGRKALTGLAKSTVAASGLPLPRFITTSLPGESELSHVSKAAGALATRHLVPLPSKKQPTLLQPLLIAA